MNNDKTYNVGDIVADTIAQDNKVTQTGKAAKYEAAKNSKNQYIGKAGDGGSDNFDVSGSSSSQSSGPNESKNKKLEKIKKIGYKEWVGDLFPDDINLNFVNDDKIQDILFCETYDKQIKSAIEKVVFPLTKMKSNSFELIGPIEPGNEAEDMMGVDYKFRVRDKNNGKQLMVGVDLKTSYGGSIGGETTFNVMQLSFDDKFKTGYLFNTKHKNNFYMHLNISNVNHSDFKNLIKKSNSKEECIQNMKNMFKNASVSIDCQSRKAIQKIVLDSLGNEYGILDERKSLELAKTLRDLEHGNMPYDSKIIKSSNIIKTANNQYFKIFNKNDKTMAFRLTQKGLLKLYADPEILHELSERHCSKPMKNILLFHEQNEE